MEKCLVLKVDVDLKSLPARLELTNIVTSLFKSRDLFLNRGGPESQSVLLYSQH